MYPASYTVGYKYYTITLMLLQSNHVLNKIPLCRFAFGVDGRNGRVLFSFSLFEVFRLGEGVEGDATYQFVRTDVSLD